MLSLHYNKIKSSLNFFWRPKRGTLISHLTMKQEILFLSVFEVAYGVQVKIWVTPGSYYEKHYLRNLKIIVWHWRKKCFDSFCSYHVIFVQQPERAWNKEQYITSS